MGCKGSRVQISALRPAFQSMPTTSGGLMSGHIPSRSPGAFSSGLRVGSRRRPVPWIKRVDCCLHLHRPRGAECGGDDRRRAAYPRSCDGIRPQEQEATLHCTHGHQCIPSRRTPRLGLDGGSPGAGKTESSKELIVELEARTPGSRVLRIDPDDLRSEFPGYDGRKSWLFQGAASTWVDRMLDLLSANIKASSWTARCPTLIGPGGT